MPRHLAIGDIHGCFESLVQLIQVVRPQRDDVVITLGDYVDRGPDSAKVLDWLLQMSETCQLRPLRGNHDVMMLEARHDEQRFQRWLKYGGDATLKSYGIKSAKRSELKRLPSSHWELLEDKLLRYFEIESHFFVHGNAMPDRPMSKQSDDMLYWTKFRPGPRHGSGKTMVCGHTSQKSGIPLITAHAICLDTRAYDTDWLSCLHVETGLIWQANSKGETRRFRVAGQQQVSALPLDSDDRV